jgi:D-alanyl-D-alanine carboxypeptidase
MESHTLLECPDELRSLLASLQISLDVISARSLVLHPQATDLVVAETDELGREHFLVPGAANAWRSMKTAASTDGVVIRIASAFRTIDRQAEIVRAKLQKGLSLESILCVSAPPGYSEHHSGRAIDVTSDGARALEQEFEQTAAFAWLSSNARRFGYFLSFPTNNRFGYAYEPWHWCFGQSEA